MTTKTSLEQGYFNWLYNRACPVSDPASDESFVEVCGVMNAVDFNDSVPNDDNRTADAIELRPEFLEEMVPRTYTRGISSFNAMPPKLFEVVVALCDRANKTTDVDPQRLFDTILQNLGLKKYNDKAWNRSSEERVRHILERVNNRDYKPNGRGGIFPLEKPSKDQTEVELWYQLSEFLSENHMY